VTEEQQIKLINKMLRVIESNWFMIPLCLFLFAFVMSALMFIVWLGGYLFGTVGFVIGIFIALVIANYLMYRIYEG